jgi:hypothetical protein
MIEAIAGRGGMGVVFRARQRQPDRTVALKVIAAELADDPQFRARFERESSIAAQIEHPNVIPVHAVGEADGVLYIAMRFIDGIDLRALLAQETRLEPRRAATIVDQVAQALDAAHSHGLVHRDVKPANILIQTLGGREHVYLTDFGLSRHVEGSVGLTGTGAFLGTVDYVAPEQARGDRVDARTDVYSLGCVLFQALTGTVPYPLDNELAKLYAHDSKPPPSALERAPDLPPQFEAVLARAMAKSPDDRYLSAGDLGRAALAASAGTSLSRAERSVAVGAAAPLEAETVARAGPTSSAGATVPAPSPAAETVRSPASPPQPPGSAVAPAGRRPSRSRVIAAGAGLAVAVVVVVVIALIASSGGGGRGSGQAAGCAGRSQPAAAQSLEPPSSQLVVSTTAAVQAPCRYRYVLVLHASRHRLGSVVPYFVTLRVAFGSHPFVPVERVKLPYPFTSGSFVSDFSVTGEPDGTAQVALSWSVRPGGATLTRYFTATPGGITNLGG